MHLLAKKCALYLTAYSFIPKDHNAQIFHNLMLGNGTYSVSVEEITGGGFNANYGVNMKVTFVVNKPSENDPSSLINAPVRNYDNGRESVVEEIRDDYVFVKDDHGESIYKFLGYYKFLNHADRTLFLSLYGSKIDIYKSQLEKKSTVIHYNAFDENDDELEQYYDLEEDSSMDDNFYTGDFNFDNFE